MSGSPATLPAPELPPGSRSALVVGAASYTDPELRGLRAPATDARHLATLLADPTVGGFDVTTVLDPTAQELRVALVDFLTARRPDDLVVLYLSCHGLTDLRRRLYFAAADTLRSRLAATGVESAWVIDQLEECRARSQIVILDCCFSGAFARGAKGDDDLALEERLLPSGRGRAVLTASNAREYSYEGGTEGPVESLNTEPAGSVFTTALLAGLRSGAADADGDGHVTVDEAYDYAYDLVRAQGAAQTPQRWLHGGEGKIVLARSPAGRHVNATPLPESLLTALGSPHPSVRLAAVTELGAWLTSGHIERETTALHVLRETADGDIPRVAEAARKLLGREPERPTAAASVRRPAPPETDAETVALQLPQTGPPHRRPVTTTSQPSLPRQATSRKSVSRTFVGRGRRLRRRAVLAIVMCSLVLAGVAAWQVGRSDDGTTTRTHTVVVSSETLWHDTGIDVEPGDRIQLTASGEIRDDDRRPKRRFGPEGGETRGTEGLARDLWDVAPDLPHGALLGRWGSRGEAFLVGRTGDLAGRSGTGQGGRLHLTVNDIPPSARFPLTYEDNEGSFRVRAVLTSRP